MVSCCVVGPSQRSEAIILRSRPYGEADKIVTFLTADAGKLTGIAKGAKNSRRRFANCLDPFTRVRVYFRVRTGASLVFMESCDLLQPPDELADPIKFAYGSYLTELVDQFTADAQPVGELYVLLIEGLNVLRSGAATAAFLRGFELRLLHCAGYGPELQHCVRCHRALQPAQRVFLDPMHGGMVCVACRAAGESLVAVAGRTLAVLEAIKAAPLGDIRVQRLGSATAAEAAQLMGHLLALHLPRALRSMKLIAALS
jgi:DNA repair protein RecO (recombination protein O)